MASYGSYDAIIADLTAGKGAQAVFSKLTQVTTANKVSSLWLAGGYPGVGSSPPDLNSRTVSRATTGAINGIRNAPTANQTFMTAVGASSSIAAGTLMLVDRLLDYGNISNASASPQSTIASGVLTRYTTGAGVEMFLETTAALGATAATCTITYTNQAGTAGRTTTFTMDVSTVVGGIPQAHGFFVPLQSGDYGVRSVQTIQFSAANTTGVCNLVLCMPITMIPVREANTYTERDMVLTSPKLFQIQDDAALQFLLQNATTTSGNIQGMISAVAN